MSGLEDYRSKRDFRRTGEPAGQGSSATRRRDGLFVVHKHAARQLHYDLRLEHDGVLESWAVPKGPGLEVGARRLAVHVEDHPLEYGEFEGTIPRKEYGGGTVMLWDRGRWHETRRDDGRIDFELDGHRLYGNWTLTRTKSGNGKRENWLLIKRSDPEAVERPPRLDRDTEDRSVATGRTMEQIAAGADAAPSTPGAGLAFLPFRRVTRRPRLRADSQMAKRQARHQTAAVDIAGIAGARRRKPPPTPGAQLATLVDAVPEGAAWVHEIKFDGYRVLAEVDGDDIRLFSRNGKDWTDRFAAIAAALGQLPAKSARLDGEIVALEPDGTSSFPRLQERLGEGRTDRLVYQLFDLTYLDGYDLTDAKLVDRKRLLSGLLERAGGVGTGVLRFTEHIEGDGRKVFDNACRLGLEGIVCKRADAPYRRTRNRHWLKVKCSRQEELLIGGFTNPRGTRTGFGALLLGARNEAGELVYAGKVGTGFTSRQLTSLHARLRRLEVDHCPFRRCPERREVHWVRPELVAEVEFTEWTRDGRLRHPAFRGLREDKDPEEIRMPQAKAAKSTGRAKPMQGGRKAVAGVTLTHPDRVLYPGQGITKLALAEYYEEIADWILPQLRRRPLSLLRCPEGADGDCFFQKHPAQTLSADVPRVRIREKSGTKEYAYVEKLEHLVALVQVGTLELHAWGCRVDRLEQPDTLVFDLDPGPDVPWRAVVDEARSLGDRLEGMSLHGFFRTTGGKGLHVVVPLVADRSWDEVKSFTRAVAIAHAQDAPRRLTVNMSKDKRRGRIFIDYLRNGRGATAVVSYSTRAREGAPVAVPVRRDELGPGLKSDRYNVKKVRRRLTALKEDPWHDFEEARRPLTRRMLAEAGVKTGTRR